MAAVVFTVDMTTTMGVEPIPNDEIAQAAAEHADVLIPFANVDPHLGRAAVREVHRFVDTYDVRGFRFHPNSDYPMIMPDRWLSDFEAVDVRPEVRPKILKHCAARLLGLAREA